MSLLLEIPTDPGQSPLLPHVYLPRPAFWARLDASTQAGATVVVGPPGAGKTLGVAGWVRADPRRRDTVWLNARRRADRDLLTAFLNAATDDAEAGTHADDAPLVVVDDAHLLPPSVLSCIDQVLAAPPIRVRLVLLTRWDLPLDLLLPGLLGTLTVLRGDVLRLDEADAATLVRAHAQTQDDRVVDAITARGRGWCAALVLAARAAAAAVDELAFAERYRAEGCPVDNLVAGEVFASLTSRQRHLLLCTAAEDEVTVDLARRLTADGRAGEALVALESTGLLVTRETVLASASPGPSSDDVRFHIHPLLREVARVRLLAGGVDVEQARSTIRGSVAVDLARGEVDHAFHRLVFFEQFEQAVSLFAPHSVGLALGPHRIEVANLARGGAPVLDRHPEWWLPLALERDLAGDTGAARHWLRRLLDHRGAEHQPGGARSRCVARLALARLGLEPLRPAIEAARELEQPTLRDPLEAVLVLQLGAAESWAGDLEAAARHLTSAAVAARASALDVLVPTALSHLAVNLLAQGRTYPARVIAQEALTSGTDEPAATRDAHARAQMVVELAELSADPWVALRAVGEEVTPSTTLALSADPGDRVWHRSLSAQRLACRGAVSEASRLLECPLEVPPLPRHLELLLLTARARLAFLLRDQQRLQAAAAGFSRLGDPCSALWAAAAEEEVADRRTQALELYQRSLATTAPDPAGTRQLSRVSAAQLLEREGHPAEAARLTNEALARSESRRDASPFLGWSLRGVDVVVLLEHARDRGPGGWAGEVRAGAASFPGLHVHFAQAHATRHELDQVGDVVVRPVLSQREREVLVELARGATYGDIAANLYVSENTVKTHVSSLYGKLGVGRRSGALAVARKLNLL